jgi:hypothetical protein
VDTGDAEALVAHALRLTPRLFTALYEDSNPAALSDAESFTLRRWVAGAQAFARREGSTIEVGICEARNRWLSLQEDPLLRKTELRWNNG